MFKSIIIIGLRYFNNLINIMYITENLFLNYIILNMSIDSARALLFKILFQVLSEKDNMLLYIVLSAGGDEMNDDGKCFAVRHFA